MRARPFVLFLILAGLFAWTACSDSDDSPADPTDPGDPGGDDPPVTSDGLIADETAVAAFASLPDAVIEDVSALRIYYGHTSHGSQLVRGLAMIADEDPTHAVPYLVEPGGDLGHQGDLTWAATTRSYLAGQADRTDVVIWSWCGGCSDNTPAGIDAYLPGGPAPSLLPGPWTVAPGALTGPCRQPILEPQACYASPATEQPPARRRCSNATDGVQGRSRRTHPCRCCSLSVAGRSTLW